MYRQSYPVKKYEGNEEVYDWLRQNPHRFNLCRIGLHYRDEKIQGSDLKEINQRLSLYDGCISSSFSLHNEQYKVMTCCDSELALLAFSIESEALDSQAVSIQFEFPYGSPQMSGSDWHKEDCHETRIEYRDNHRVLVKRVMDKTHYMMEIQSEETIYIEQENHQLKMKTDEKHFQFTVRFFVMDEDAIGIEKEVPLNYGDIKMRGEAMWHEFWERAGAIRLRDSKDGRGVELERRIVLSLYLMRLNSCGTLPPSETGLTCNSWYGKAHLEMYFWHLGWTPLWHMSGEMEKSLEWYRTHVESARENAKRNGYKGCRWPKMIGPQGIDCPSPIAPLLLWQQPHLIFMLDLAYRRDEDKALLKRYWVLVKESADFMVDIVQWNPQTNCYDLPAPSIPVQERHQPEITVNPAFEVAYWANTLMTAVTWGKMLGYDYDPMWEKVGMNMARLSIVNDRYMAHDNCPLTFERFNIDHPSMLMAYGVLPDRHLTPSIDEKTMEKTLMEVVGNWHYESLWGWDFAVMAMTAVRLKKPELAIDLILKDTPKNHYEKNGHNRQITRNDLPLYLPGNGSLLLAVGMMGAGYEGCSEPTPGFPKDGQWTVQVDGISSYA